MARGEHGVEFVEQLLLTPEACDLSRLIGGPVLDGHRQGGTADVLGVVEAASVDGRQGVATLKFSERAREIYTDITSGALRQVSVGYLVHEWSDGGETEDGLRIRVAVKWQPVEISVVPIAAESGATTRGDPRMSESETAAAVANRAGVDAQIRKLCAFAKIDAEPLVALGDLEFARRAALDRLTTRSDATAPRLSGVAHETMASALRPWAKLSSVGWTRVAPRACGRVSSSI